MNRSALVVLTLAILLLVAGCAKNDPDTGKAGNNKKAKSAVESTRNPQTQSGKGDSKEAPDLVIKTENQVSNQEAGALLDEVDRQLNDLMNTLNQLDDVEDKDLEY